MKFNIKSHQSIFCRLAAVVLCLVVLSTGPAALRGQSLPSPKSPLDLSPAKAGVEEITLEKFFTRGNLFSTKATSPAFSFDGKYAAYLYRPTNEWQQGNYLWVREPATGKTVRIRSLHKPEPEAGSAAGGPQRFRNIDAFIWSPTAAELLFQAGADVRRWKVGDKKPRILAGVQADQGSVAYLPNGRGFVYLQAAKFMQLAFGGKKPTPLPVLQPAGEKVSWYQVSPNGKRLAWMTFKWGPAPMGYPSAGSLTTYKGRFAAPANGAREVADGPHWSRERAIYLANFGAAKAAAPRRVFTLKTTGPADFLSWPTWSPDSGKIVFALFRQSTNEVQVLQAEAATATRPAARKGAARPARVLARFRHTGGPRTPAMIRPFFLADSRRLVLLTEQSGFRHLYRIDPVSRTAEPLTRGRFEVYPLGPSRDRQWFYVAATKEHPACRDVYRVSLTDGTMERLSGLQGVYGDEAREDEEKGLFIHIANIAVSPDGKTVLANFARFGTPQQLVCSNSATGARQVVADPAPEALKKLTTARPELFSYKNRHGQEIHGYLFKPDGWASSDKRPLLIYVYGGPLGVSKQVMEGAHGPDSYYFGYYMARKHGYVTCVIDPRGSSGYGAAFEKANFGQPGKPQVEDLVDGVKYLVANYGVDARRVGVHGWSFGGFQTQMCLYTAPEVFAAGIAGAGPTEWENYNAWYVTTVIGIPLGSKPTGRFSLLPLARNLKGRLLLMHGMEDPNVLFQDTVKVYRELLRAGKETQVELFLDPSGGHSMNGDVFALALYRKAEDFLLRALGKGEPSRGLDLTVAR